ncbi:hypothetical protein VKT23_017577 [Stygiomarasmius scandens]|uniref:Uncharacterized protein n=1 Tax=Marasmiellus scandens TaxID=2682957 RepID=A0ABR1IRS0_9AGAR
MLIGSHFPGYAIWALALASSIVPATSIPIQFQSTTVSVSEASPPQLSPRRNLIGLQELIPPTVKERLSDMLQALGPDTEDRFVASAPGTLTSFGLDDPVQSNNDLSDLVDHVFADNDEMTGLEGWVDTYVQYLIEVGQKDLPDLEDQQAVVKPYFKALGNLAAAQARLLKAYQEDTGSNVTNLGVLEEWAEKAVKEDNKAGYTEAHYERYLSLNKTVERLQPEFDDLDTANKISAQGYLYKQYIPTAPAVFNLSMITGGSINNPQIAQYDAAWSADIINSTALGGQDASALQDNLNDGFNSSTVSDGEIASSINSDAPESTSTGSSSSEKKPSSTSNDLKDHSSTSTSTGTDEPKDSSTSPTPSPSSKDSPSSSSSSSSKSSSSATEPPKDDGGGDKRRSLPTPMPIITAVPSHQVKRADEDKDKDKDNKGNKDSDKDKKAKKPASGALQVVAQAHGNQTTDSDGNEPDLTGFTRVKQVQHAATTASDSSGGNTDPDKEDDDDDPFAEIPDTQLVGDMVLVELKYGAWANQMEENIAFGFEEQPTIASKYFGKAPEGDGPLGKIWKYVLLVTTYQPNSTEIQSVQVLGRVWEVVPGLKSVKAGKGGENSTDKGSANTSNSGTDDSSPAGDKEKPNSQQDDEKSDSAQPDSES